jgi:hypothetical protein
VGWFYRRGKPVFGYSNSAVSFAERNRRHLDAIPDLHPGIAVEGFGLPDNLMIPGAVLEAVGHPMVLPPDNRSRSFEVLDVSSDVSRSLRRRWAASSGDLTGRLASLAA